MALSSTVLRDLMDTKLAGANANYASSPARAEMKAALGELAEAIVEHITANAVVTVTSVSGVTTGAGVSGPGSGTIS